MCAALFLRTAEAPGFGSRAVTSIRSNPGRTFEARLKFQHTRQAPPHLLPEADSGQGRFRLDEHDPGCILFQPTISLSDSALPHPDQNPVLPALQGTVGKGNPAPELYPEHTWLVVSQVDHMLAEVGLISAQTGCVTSTELCVCSDLKKNV